MKKLEDFQAEKVELKTVYGGTRVATSSSTPNGNCQNVTTDEYDDANGNGKWDKNEYGSSRTTLVC